MKLLPLLTYFIAFCFTIYGISCLFTAKMKTEFIRFGLNDNLRVLTGVLQIIGSIGLVVGLYYTLIGVLAAGGLSLLMAAGWITRLKIKDGWYESAPAFVFMVLNGFLCYKFIQLF